MRLCTVEGCGRPHVARGLCKRHYQLEYRRRGLTRDLSESWRPMPFALLPAYPHPVAAALHDLAESNPSPERYEAEKARILGGSGV